MHTEALWVIAWLGIGWLFMEVCYWNERRNYRVMKRGETIWIVFGWPVVLVLLLLKLMRRYIG